LYIITANFDVFRRQQWKFYQRMDILA
jgi:hypothetical protein